MAEIKGPLFSLGATGSIGKELTFRKQRGQQHAQRHFTTRNPQSARQTSIRYAFRNLLREWKTLTQTQKDSWDNWVKAKKKRHLRGYDLFGTENFEQYHATGTFEKWADTDLKVTATTGEKVSLTTGEIIVVNMRD